MFYIFKNIFEYRFSIRIFGRLNEYSNIRIFVDIPKENTSMVEKRQFYRGNYETVREDLSLIGWAVMHNMTVQESFDFICDVFKTCIDFNVPVKRSDN